MQQDSTTTTKSSGPSGLVRLLRSSKAGISFVKERIAYYEAKACKGEDYADLAMLAQFLEIQGSFHEALEHLKSIPIASSESSWLASRYRIEKHIKYELKRRSVPDHALQSKSCSSRPTLREVPVENPHSLSISRFYVEYAIPGVPVIIKGTM